MIRKYKLASFLSLALLITILLVLYAKMNKTNIRYWYQDFTRDNSPYTLLLGSSSILRMPGDLLKDCENPVIYGFNNGLTENINSYLKFANLDNVNKVILYIGENDIARGEKPERTFSQLNEIIQIIKVRIKGDIALVKLKYSPSRANYHVMVLELNLMLENEFSNTEGVKLIPFDEIKGADLFIADGTHLNKRGNIMFSNWINDFCRNKQ